MILMFVSMIYALGSIAAETVLTPFSIGAGVVFLAALIVFIRHEKHCPAPLVDLSIFSHPAFLFPIIGLVLVFVANFMMAVVGPFYLEGVMGYRPSQVGMIFLINPAAMVVMAPIAGWLYDRRRTPYYATAGMAVSAAAFFILAYCAVTRNIAGILGGFALLGIGLGLFQTPNNTAIMNALPSKHLSIASSVTATGRNLGMALGVSIGSILLSVQLAMMGYHGEVVSADPSVLASSISMVMVLSGLLCVIVTVLTLKK
jgi:predicted MFS family arabinose efflux permease